MEILTTRQQSLSLEARHTISLAVSKQRRLKVANSLFLPRKSIKQILPITKETDKEKGIMNSRLSHPADINNGTSNSIPSGSTAPISASSKKYKPRKKTVLSRLLNNNSSVPQNVPKKNLAVKKREENSQITSLSVCKELPVRPIATTATTATSENQTVQFSTKLNLPTSTYNDQPSSDHIIEISSDEEDTKVGLEQLPPLWRIPQRTAQNINQPIQGMPVQGMPVQGMSVQGMSLQGMPIQGIPVQSVPMQNPHVQNIPFQNNHHIYAENHPPMQYHPYPPAQPICFRPLGYPQQPQYFPGFSQTPVNYQPGFYTESYPNTYRQLGITMPGHMNQQEMRYQPYQSQPMPEQPSPPKQQNPIYPANPAQGDISKWLLSRYQQPVNTPQLTYGPMSCHPVPEPQQAVQAFYERMYDIYQAGLSRELAAIQSNQFWTENNRPMAADYGTRMSMMREQGTSNTWNNSQAMTRRRMNSNTGPPNLIRPQSTSKTQLQTSQAVQADSTTGGNSLFPTSISRGMLPQNVSAFSPRYPQNSQNVYNPEPSNNLANNSTTMPPAMNQLSLNENLCNGYYRNLTNIPEYDPRHNR